MRTHLTLRATVISRKVGLLRHLSLLGELRAHAHQQFVALGIWGCSHEVHQEFRVAIVASSIGTTGALTGGTLALAHKILKKLLRASLLLGSRSMNLLYMMRRRSTERAFHSSIRPILLER